MNRWLTLILIGLAGILASCGSSVSSSTQPGTHDEYTVAVTPAQFTLNSGDWSTISAIAEVSNQNSTPKAISPQPTIKFTSSDPRVTVSPVGEVCAGQWDSRYLVCTPTVLPASTCIVANQVTTCTPNPNAGMLDLPTGYVTITAYDSSHGASGTSIVSIHPRATNIALSAPGWAAASLPTGNCISQNQQVKYVATPTFGSNALPTTSLPFDNDYTWTVGDSNVATVSTYGYVIAHNPGVTNVYASLNGTVSVPLAFATCPPASIVLSHSPFTKNAAVAPFSTTDIDSTDSNCAVTDSCILNKGDQKYFTITEVLDANGNAMHPLDTNGNPLPIPTTLPVTYVTSDLLLGSFSTTLPLTEDFTTKTSGRTIVMAACEPSTCNAAVPDFAIPSASGPVQLTSKAAGFGYPVYSNVIGVTVQGTTSSTVLVTGTTFAKDGTPAFHLLVYDSESLAVIHTVELGNSPNSLVVAPNGLKAYVGSSAGLVVVDLSTYVSSLRTFTITGEPSTTTAVITGKVLGVSPDSRYVLVSDTSDPSPVNHLVFFIDTTTKIATRYMLPNIHAVTFSPDNSNFWIAGDAGVYVYNSDAFVPTLTNVSSGVEALAWTPDGQSYFASGSQLANYSTCDDQNPQFPPIPTGSPINLSTTAIGGVSQVIGLSTGNQWLDYSVTKTPPAGQTVPPGYVCSGTVAISTAAPTPSALPCTANEITFSKNLEQAFVTGVVDPSNTSGASSCSSPDSFIHGFDLNTHAAITLSTADTSVPIIPLSGGVLSDGRKLYIGTYNSASKTAALRRFDLTTGTEDVVTSNVTNSSGVVTGTTTTVPATVELVPSFVAVVPK
jgi:hypothetical protein